MENVNPTFTLYDSSIECTMTDKVIFPKSNIKRARFFSIKHRKSTDLQQTLKDPKFYDKYSAGLRVGLFSTISLQYMHTCICLNIYFHQIGPLGQFDLVVTMPVCCLRVVFPFSCTRF